MVWGESKATLPTDMAWVLSGMDFSDRRLKKAVKLLAREVDVTPRFLFGLTDLDGYEDPLTGQKLSGRTLARITDSLAPEAIASMFRQASTGTPRKDVQRQLKREGRSDVERVEGVDPVRVSKLASGILRALGRDEDIDAGSLITAAAVLARRGVNPKTFTDNLRQIAAWVKGTGQEAQARAPRGPSRPEFDWQWQIFAALQATQARQRFGSTLDVVKYFVGPATRQAIERGETREAATAGRTQAATTGLGAAYGVRGASIPEDAVAAETLAQARLMVTQPGQTDFFAEAQKLERQVVLDETAFARSWVGRRLNDAEVAFGEVWKFGQKALVEIGTVLVSPAIFAAAAAPGGKDFGDAWNFLQGNRHYAYQRLNAGDTAGELIQEGFGLDHWTSYAFDFTIGWLTDPTVVLGKTLGFARSFRVAPELLEASVQARRILGSAATAERSAAVRFIGTPAQRFAKAVREFSTSKVAKRIYEAMYSGKGSTSRWFHELDRLRVNYEARSALDYAYMKALRDKVLQKYPTASKEAFDDFSQGLIAHFGFTPPKGSLAEEVVRIRTQGASAVHAKLNAVGVADEPKSVAVDLAEDVLSPHLFRYEVPQYKLGGIGRFGPRTLTRRLLTSRAVTSTGLGRRAARLPSINPGRIMSFGDDPAAYVRLHARRGRVFTEGEVRVYESRAYEIVNGGAGVENRLTSLVDEINVEHLRRVIGRYKVSDDLAGELTDDILNPVREMNRKQQTFGAVSEGEKVVGFQKPLLETQLQNRLFVIDPVVAENLVQRFVGVPRRMRQTLARAMEKAGVGEVPEITDALGAWHDATVWTTEITSELARSYRRYLKGLWVARPGYIPRVILGDELARSLVSNQSVLERLVAQKSIGYVAEKLGIKRLASRSFNYGDETVEATLPWRFAKEPLASNNIRAADAVNELAQDSKLFFQAGRADGSWDVVKATTKNKSLHLKSWNRALLRDFGNSVPGREALEAVAAGKNVDDTQKILEAWARKVENVPLRRRSMAVADDEVKQWAEELSKLSHAYTMAGTKYQRDIARSILDGSDDLRPFLARIPLKERPPVHGPSITAVTGGPRITPQKLLDGWYSLVIRLPEDMLNRQPFYRIWKARAERAYMAQLEARGVTKLTADARKVIDLASRSFALAQVRQVMFDFTKQSRFTELLQFLAPFPQPFFEGFQAWGHLVVQHPELIGRARALFELGTDTGFVTKDPETGEWIVAMSPWAWIARKTGLLPPRVAEALGFTSQLRSFNMLTSSAIELPGGDGWIGRFAGGVPIPIPGLDPAWMELGQRLFKDSTNRSLTGWLFQYGPRVEWAPRLVRVVANTLDPDSMDEEQVKSYANEILKEYQKMGLDVDEHGKPIPTATLRRWALDDAEDLIWARNVASLFSPAALNVRFDHDEIEETYNSVLEKDGPDAAHDWLKKNHPDLTLIGLSKYYYAKQYRDPRTGEPINAPKIPSSRLFAEMVREPGFRSFAAKYPEWLAILLVGLDPDVAYEFDPITRNRQVADGLLKVKDPGVFWSQGENVKVWDEIDGFYKSVWNPTTARMEAQGLDDQDIAYQRLILARQEFFSDLYTRYPSWVRHNLDVKYNDAGTEVIGWDWPQDAPETPAEIVMKDARAIAALDGFQNFPGIRALGDYLEGRDEIATDMRRLGITDIESDSAIDAGLRRRYVELKRDVIESIPEDYASVMEQFIEGYFRGDLQGFQTDQREALAKLGPELQQKVERFDTDLEQLKDKAYRDYDQEWQRSQSYQDVREYIDKQMRANSKVIEAWWDTEIKGTPGEQEYKDGLISLPTVFWSRWDWHVMGVELTDVATDALNEIGQARVEIARREEKDPVGFSESAGYDAIDRAVLDFRGKDKTFDKAIAAMNDWTFPIEKAGLAKQPGRTGDAWAAVIRTMREAQGAINQAELTGVDSFDTDARRRAYDQLQDELLDWVKEWQDFAPGFREQWYEIQADVGDPLIGSLFLPNSYYGPTGVVEYG
jgi:hypothetical protein